MKRSRRYGNEIGPIEARGGAEVEVPRVTVEVNDAVAVIEAEAEGVYVGLLPSLVVEHQQSASDEVNVGVAEEVGPTAAK